MIVHIVMFKFKEENKVLNIAKVHSKLESLESKIDVVHSMEVGINFNEGQRAYDLSLYSTFETEEDLKAYAVHEEHLKVIELIREVTTDTKVVDYILE